MYFRAVGAVALALFTLSLPSPARAATPEEVEQAIKKGVLFLYKAQNKDGNWEQVPQAIKIEQMRKDEATGKMVGTGKFEISGPHTSSGQWGGLTAISTYALLAAGQSPQDARLAKAINLLKNSEIPGTYAAGMRAQVWPFLKSPDARNLARRDAQYFYNTAKTKGAARGLYDYLPDPKGERYDHSVSQYGVLGMWACSELNLELPDDYWRVVDQAWKAHQYPDGSWSYVFNQGLEKGHPPSIAMTAAGVATLFITQDFLYRNAGIQCNGNYVNENIDYGLRWVSQHFKDIYKSEQKYYTFYGIERIGVASGYKYFGTTDWYAEGADFIVKNQSKENGSWDNSIPNTCFSLLFLVRGSAPVMMNKLDYGGGKGKPATWNQRPRDVANLAKWVGKQTERFLNWQIVNLKVDVDELHDAPILYISGSAALAFTKEEEAKLKQFVEQGGMILGNADCASKEFANSFKKLGQSLFPYEFRQVPTSHVIYSNQQYRGLQGRTAPVFGLSNGARELMLLMPTGDPARYWQTQTVGGRDEFHQVAANIFLYAVDRQNLRAKGETFIVKPAKESKATTSIKLARLEYPGNWNPEPGGWRRLSALMRNENLANLSVETVKLGSGALKDYKVAHLTGTAPFHFDAASREEIKKFTESGGLLIIDAAGGSSEFGLSVSNELTAIFGSALLKPLKTDHPLYRATGKPITDVAYRAFAIKSLGKLKQPRLHGLDVNGKLAVIVSSEDLSVGLVGQPIDGILGYEPHSATQLMSSILMYSANPKPASAPAQPATAAPKK